MRKPIAATLALFVAVTVMAPNHAAARTVHGAVVMDDAKEVGENRFASAKDWEHTVEFYRRQYAGKAGISWHTLETPPKVTAVHIANTLARRTWDGLNLYEADGKVTIFVLEAETSARTRPSTSKARRR